MLLFLFAQFKHHAQEESCCTLQSRNQFSHQLRMHYVFKRIFSIFLRYDWFWPNRRDVIALDKSYKIAKSWKNELKTAYARNKIRKDFFSLWLNFSTLLVSFVFSFYSDKKKSDQRDYDKLSIQNVNQIKSMQLISIVVAHKIKRYCLIRSTTSTKNFVPYNINVRIIQFWNIEPRNYEHIVQMCNAYTSCIHHRKRVLHFFFPLAMGKFTNIHARR